MTFFESLDLNRVKLSQADIEKIVKAWRLYEKNKDNATWTKSHWNSTPWGISYNVCPKGKYPNKEKAIGYFILSLMLPWKELTDQLTRTVKNSFRVSKSDMQDVIDNLVLPNLQQRHSDIAAIVNKVDSELEENLCEDINSLDKTTPYMLRNDGEFIRCGEVHPYVKMFFKDDFDTNFNKLLSHPEFIRWFYRNTLLEETKQLIAELLYAISNEVTISLIGELKIERPIKVRRNIEAIFNELNDITNQEFCRVRTSNFKYKYGGDNGEIYFRISSRDFDWFDLIWLTVNNFKSQIKFITIMKDYAVFGEQFAYIKDGKHEFNKMPVEEFLTLPGHPIVEDLDIEEDIEKHNELNPKIFKDNKLIPEVREACLRIVNEFIEGLANDGITLKPKDIILIGSNASYNYTKDSDIDLHIVADMTELEDPEQQALLYNAYKTIWNNKYDIVTNDIPTEIYVETADTPRVSNGCYSILKDAWINEPEAEAIPELDQDSFNQAFADWEERYNDIIKDVEKPDEVLTENYEQSKAIMASQLRDEWEAIQSYRKAAAELKNSDEGNFDQIINLLNNIAEEEEQHVGELQSALATIDNTVETKIGEGKDEGEEKLANPLAGNFEECLTEALSPAEEERKIIAWHNGGTRNTYTMKDPKLKMDYDICVKKGYTREANILLNRAKQLGYSWANSTTVQKQNAPDKTFLASSYSYHNELQQLNWLEDLLLWFNNMNFNNPKDVEQLGGKFYTEKGTLMLLLILMALGRTQKVDTVKQALIKNGFSVNEIKRGIAELLKDAQFKEDLAAAINKINSGEILEEEVHTPEIDKIDAFINDIYELRRSSLEADGEYSQGNLIFKEIRNRGYLDKLKELKNKLVGKELSLETITEDTVKQGNAWVNKGDSGETHGKFRTKKAADAQRKAIYASGWHK